MNWLRAENCDCVNLIKAFGGENDELVNVFVRQKEKPSRNPNPTSEVWSQVLANGL